MHILLIHQAFVSGQEAGGTRHYELARELVRQGHRVTIIASFVSYLTGQLHPLPRRRWLVCERADGIEVWRTWAYPALHRSFFARGLSFLSFMFSSFVAGLMVRRVEIVWGTSPPIFQALTAWLVAKVKRVPYVFEVRDLWPDFAVEIGVLRSPMLIRAARELEHFLYHGANQVVPNSPGFIPHLRHCCVPNKKIKLVCNSVEVTMFDPADGGDAIREELGLGNRFVALYAGAHGLANDLGTVLRAAKRVEAYRDIVFVLVGDGKERPALVRQAEHLGLSNVRFIPAQPKARMPAFLAASDVCIAILKDIPMFTTTYPNKVFDYMAAGRPTVLAIDGVIRKVIEAAEGGTFVQPGDAQALEKTVLAYYSDPELRQQHGRNARSYVATHFDRGQQADRLLALFRSLKRPHRTARRIQPTVKRLLDVLCCSMALILLSPVMGVVAVAVRLTMRGRVLYVSRRPGLGGRIFRLYKFRTMTDERGPEGELLPDSARLTALGRLIRRFSVDEVPQFWNVLKGDMSLVGPRPLLAEYLDRYTPTQARRHEVRPGITGWAQVNGRNALTWEEKFAHDVWYVDHQSLWLDLKIALRTLGMVIKREGLWMRGEMNEPFMGSADDTTDSREAPEMPSWSRRAGEARNVVPARQP